MIEIFQDCLSFEPIMYQIWKILFRINRVTIARLAQSVEHETLNLRVVGSSPTLGDLFLGFHHILDFAIWINSLIQ